MRIYIDDAYQDKRIFEGRYQYLEGGETDGKPSFHILANGIKLEDGKKSDYEIYFYLDSQEELESLIQDLQDLKKSDKQ